MTRSSAALAIIAFAIGCGGPPPAADGGTDAGRAIDGGRDASAEPRDGSVLPDAGSARWDARSCDLTIRHAPPSGVSDVRIAGEFTGWADAPLPLRDDDGDGVYEITLSPSARVMSGERYAYKLIEGGTWILDPASSHREYVDGCLNSAFVMPACSAGPEIRAEELVTNADGRATTRITILTAADGSPPRAIAMSLDGAPLP